MSEFPSFLGLNNISLSVIFQILFGIYLEMEFQNHLVILFFEGLLYCLTWSLHHFTFLPNSACFSFSVFLSTLVIFCGHTHHTTLLTSHIQPNQAAGQELEVLECLGLKGGRRSLCVESLVFWEFQAGTRSLARGGRPS